MQAGYGHAHQAQFAGVVDAGAQEEFIADGAALPVLGERYRRLLTELFQIASYQFAQPGGGIVRGFLLSGPPGVGKTMLGKRLGFELAHAGDGGEVALVVVDGSHLARPRYGESEERIRALFAQARDGFGVPGRRSVLLFDDVESLFMSRGAEYSKEWHFSQESVFFHAADDLDPSRTIVVLTTNRPDLVDAAIRDRFLEYEVGYPCPEVLLEVARQTARVTLPAVALPQLDERLLHAVGRGQLRSMRDAQRFVMICYVESVLGTTSLRHD